MPAHARDRVPDLAQAYQFVRRFVGRLWKGAMHINAASLALCVLAAVVGSAAGTSAQITQEDASYVFHGTVLEPIKGGTLDPEAEGYLVRVDKVVYQTGQFADQKGRKLFLLEPEREMREGDSLVFLTEPVIFGDIVTAKSIRIMDAQRFDPGGLEKQRDEVAMRVLQERLKDTQLVVLGTVAGVSDFDRRGGVDSEHDPMLRNASVKVERLLKGELDGDETRFLIATSDDVQWYRAPKLQEGDTGIFLLRPAPDTLRPFGASSRIMALIDPLDFLSTESMPMVEELLRQ